MRTECLSRPGAARNIAAAALLQSGRTARPSCKQKREAALIYNEQLFTKLDESFPGQDLDEDWPSYSGISRLEDGPIPIACTLRSTVATYTITFQRAQQLQRDLGRSGRVAVLCASNELFRRYLDFKELRTSFLAVTSREEAAGVADSVRRFIFSMPEFVAGHQFDTVLLIDVNRNEVPDGPYAAAALRKFASQVAG